MIVFCAILFWWFICGIIGSMIGASRGQGVSGFMVGAFFGPLGWALMCLECGPTIAGVIAFMTMSALAMLGLAKKVTSHGSSSAQYPSSESASHDSPPYRGSMAGDQEPSPSSAPSPGYAQSSAPVYPPAAYSPLQDAAAAQARANAQQSMQIARKYGGH